MDHTKRFGRVWSYMAWGKSIFMFFWKYRKLTSSPNTSKLVLGPPDWSSDCFENQGSISGAIKPINFPKNDHRKQNPEPAKPSKIIICLIKSLAFLCMFLSPMPCSCLFELKCSLGPSKESMRNPIIAFVTNRATVEMMGIETTSLLMVCSTLLTLFHDFGI